MKHYKIIIAALFFTLSPLFSYATVDYLMVNHLTQEYYWADEDHSTGWIGWKTIPETSLDFAEELLIKEGYTETHFPFKIEAVLVLLIIGISFLILRKIKK